MRTVKVGLHMAILVSRAREVVREPAGGREVDCCSSQVVLHDDLGIEDGSVGRKLASPNRSHVRASGGVLRIENERFGAEAAICRTVACERGHTVIA